jgi:hypothetical protein
MNDKGPKMRDRRRELRMASKCQLPLGGKNSARSTDQAMQDDGHKSSTQSQYPRNECCCEPQISMCIGRKQKDEHLESLGNSSKDDTDIPASVKFGGQREKVCRTIKMQ